MKYVPNFLSCCRVILSLLLPVSLDNKTVFLVLYTICGLTDFADGFIARKLNFATAAGAKLDSIADVVFSVVTLYLILSQASLGFGYYLLFCVLLVGGVRIINILITKIKFKQWNVIHTIASKVTGLVLFLILPVHFIWGSVPAAIVVICVSMAFFASLEETCILLLTKFYDVNCKSLLSYTIAHY